MEGASFDKVKAGKVANDDPSELASRCGEEVIANSPPVRASVAAPPRRDTSKMSRSHREAPEFCSGLESITDEPQLALLRGSNGMLQTDCVDTRLASIMGQKGIASNIVASGEHS